MYWGLTYLFWKYVAGFRYVPLSMSIMIVGRDIFTNYTILGVKIIKTIMQNVEFNKNNDAVVPI